MLNLNRPSSMLMLFCAASIMVCCAMGQLWAQEAGADGDAPKGPSITIPRSKTPASKADESKAKPADGAATEPATKPADKPASDKPPIISATDVRGLAKYAGKEVIVRGIVVTTRTGAQSLVLYFSKDPGGFAVAIPLAKVGNVLSSILAAGGKLRGSILDVRGTVKRNEPLGEPIIVYSDGVIIAPAPQDAKIPDVIDQAGSKPTAGLPGGPSIDLPKKEQKPFADELKRAVSMFKSKLWPYRAFAILRMDRYPGEQRVMKVIELGLADRDWHVRCFALWAMARHKFNLPEKALLREIDPRVVRLALRLGYKLPGPLITRHARANLRKRNLEELMMGIEIAAASNLEVLQKDAWKRLVSLIGNMDDRAAVLLGSRLDVLLLNGVIGRAVAGKGAPADLLAARDAIYEELFWKAWMRKNIKNGFPAQDISPRVRASDGPLVAKVDWESFDEHTRYLEYLSQQNIDVTIVMDGTGSMGWVIKRAQAGVDRLVLILNDLSQEMRLGVVIYRDTTDTKPLEAFKMTKKISYVRNFLVGIRATGGGDIPEAVLLGLEACEKLGWKRSAEQIVVVIGDAPPHAGNEARIEKQIKRLRGYGAHIHAINVGESPETTAAFAKIAKLGKGKSMMLAQNLEVSKEILRLTVDESVQPVFDDFYDMYVKLCF